ncbi:hypothetical protein LSTR_LSTR001971 [Laodelphax striatellus]|uniref:ERCC4 domain-containing protein n=1 Tax=Laodelphax striatellus TaxID=195883 RepID=A0A482XHK5_LAOST|nr:hypothetical protein LSTR_LSTR001971 [Laodelphax striatellus]
MELENEEREKDIPFSQDFGKTAPAKGSRSRAPSKEERLAMKEIKMREKLEKNATREKLRQMKPGECIKSMKVIIDSNIVAYRYLYQSIENALQEFGADLTVEQQPIRNSITWSRSGSAFTDREDSENDAVIIWSSEKFSSVVCNDKLSYAIQTIKERLPNKRVTLLIYSGSDIGMESEDLVPSLDSVNAYGARRKKATTLNKKRLEMELGRLQFEHDCSYRLIEARGEVGKVIAQFTKAISEIPFRKERERQEQELAWLAAADSRGCVRVNKSSHGLAQLWTQQLLQFNNCNLDAANEITKRYPTPQALVKAYERCATEQEASTLLKEIPIVRKCIGDLAARRKLGPELSRKLHLLFTCKDPNVQLYNE